MTRAALLLVALAGAGPAFAQPAHRTPRPNPGAPTAAYVNGRWYEADSAGVRFVPGERYAVAGVFTAERPARVDTVLDLGGAFVVPPFGEAHNHSAEGPWTAAEAARYLRQGVFYYKNPNSVRVLVARAEGQFNRPDALDMAHAYGGLTAGDGHPSALYRALAPRYRLRPDSLDGLAYFLVPTVAVLEARWPQVLAGQPNFVKLYLLNAAREGDGHSQGLAPDVFARAVALAHEAGLPVTAHVDTVADLALAVEAGADEAAHLPGRAFKYGLGPEAYRISDALARRMAARDVTVVTTATVTEVDYGEDPAKGPVQALQAENLRRLHAAGVPLAVGTDRYGWTALDQARLLRRLGAFADADLLRIWVETGPRSVFPRRAIGTFAPGYEASFVVLACDPVARFACVEQVAQRVKQGAVLGAPAPAE